MTPAHLKIFKSSRGVLLLETMVALSILAISLLSLLALYTQSLGYMRVATDRYVATYLAAEGLEMVKNRIDNNIYSGLPFNNGISNDSPFFQSISGSLEYDSASNSYIQNPRGRFERLISILPDSTSDILKIKSSVTWKSRGGVSFSADLEDNFYNWQ